MTKKTHLHIAPWHWVIIILFAAALVLLFLLLPDFSDTKAPANSTQPCTLEARICDNGAYVGRSGPACEFEECPDTPPVKP